MTDQDRRPWLYASFRHAADLVAGVDPAALRRPTPCRDYDVGTLVDHLVGAGHRTVALGRGEEPTGEEFPHAELADAPDQLRRAGKDAEAAWSDDARLSATVVMPWGETYTGATLVDMYLTELATHTWDLAMATGQLARLDSDLAAPALDAAHAMLKPEYRNAAEEGSPFGSEIEAPPDADTWEQLAAFMGRRPRRSLS